MKFTVDSSALNKALKVVAPAVSNNSIIPMLDNVHCEVNGNVCVLTATNSRLTIKTSIEVSSDENFTGLIPFKESFKISSLGVYPLQISFQDEVQISFNKRMYKLGKKEDASLFPVQPEFNHTFSMEASDDFLYALQLAKGCVLKGISYEAFIDVCIKVEEGFVNVIACDKIQLFRYKEPFNTKHNFQMLVNTDFIKSISGINEGVITTDGDNIRLKTDKTEITGQLGLQSFPDVSFMFPEYKANCIVDRDELLSEINGMMVFDSLVYDLILTFSKKGFNLKFEDPDKEQTFNSDIQAKNSVPIESIRFNGALLKNILTMIPEKESVFINITAPNKLVNIEYPDSKTQFALMPLFNQPVTQTQN